MNGNRELIRAGEVDFHICGGQRKRKGCETQRACTGKCPYCYVDGYGGRNDVFADQPLFGDVDILKAVLSNIYTAALKDVGGDNREKERCLVLVGGDPCMHPCMMGLLEHIKALGGMHKVCILSNTHIYKDAGIAVPIEWIVPFVDELDFTLHGIGAAHDAINGNNGAYARGMEQLKRFMAARGTMTDKGVAIVLNFVPYTLNHLEEMMNGVIEELGMKPGLDYFMIQRIAPTGLAALDYDRWKISSDALVNALGVIERMHNDKGFETNLDTVDVFPWCAIPEEYHYMLHEGGCQWGQPDGVLSVLPDGKIQRCALSGATLGSFLDIETPEQFTEFMRCGTLEAFRNHRHLDPTCLNCGLLAKCGGGCVMATGGDPYADKRLIDNGQVPIGHDYLRPDGFRGYSC